MSSSNLREELQKIYDAKGQLTASDVVDEARDPGHPLHGRFEWDNSIAAARFREEQAKQLIRSCKITYRDDTHPVSKVRAFQHVRRADGTPTYMPSEEVAVDPVAREVLMRQMAREWKAMKDRYKNFSEFVQMVLSDPELAGTLDATGSD